MFWYRWNSWVVELLGGAALSLLLCGVGTLLLHGPNAVSIIVLLALIAGSFVSLFYELRLDVRREDSTHNPVADVLQRFVGQVAGLVLYVTARAVLG